MPLIIPQSTLLQAAETIAAVAKGITQGGKSIMTEAHLSMADGRLILKGCDTANWLTVSVPMDGEIETIQVNADKFSESVRGIRADKVKLSVEDGVLTMQSKGGKRILRATPCPYPEPTAITGPAFIMEANRLKECLSFCESSISDDPSKAALMGVHIHSHAGKHRAASYNGVVLATIEMQSGTEDIGCTIASRTVMLLKRIPDGAQVEVTQGERQISFRWEDGELVSSMIAAPFIEYIEKIPTHEATLAVRGPEMVAAVRAVSGIASEEIVSRSKRIKLSLGERVSLHTESRQGQADELADAEWSGEIFDIHFASGRMESALKGFGDDELSIGITKVPDDVAERGVPMTIRSMKRDDRIALVMPLRS